jgi:peptide-methionine (R)-S-oxide reductase
MKYCCMADKPNYRKDLTPEQYEVCGNRSTESVFRQVPRLQGQGHLQVCLLWQQPLFTSDTKFDSGTGWLSFWSN